jgi:hypothetical protein
MMVARNKVRAIAATVAESVSVYWADKPNIDPCDAGSNFVT